MTTDQIKETLPHDLSTNTWLKEIALQLAQLAETKQEIPVKRGPGRPPK